MRKLALFGIAVFAAACGGHNTNQSVCDQDPSSAACTQTCDPTAGAPSTCPAGYHCQADGTCDAQCTPNGGECGSGNTCTADGRCEPGDPMTPDSSCASVHFTPTKTTPSITLVLDRSGSMDQSFGNTTRYQAMIDGLFGTTGAVTTTQGQVYFGEALYSGDQSPCLNLNGFSVPRALNNATAMRTLTVNNPPGGSTPTAPAIDQVVADFAANPPPAGSPPIILLATDGAPNSCGSTQANLGPSITAAKDAYAAGVRLFIVGLAGLNTQFLQDMANAGTGVMTGQAPNCTGCSPFYVANDPASLAASFNSIINGVISCDLTITGQVDPATANQGTVTLNGTMLTYGTDWVVDPNGMTIHLLGQACTDLKSSANPVVDASFPCGTVVLF